ncbi:hypothetical protein [Mycolicibacterium palauense]|uniref:hypothetical protein n=1 Tax=Mycolicibacterium palauense TaxID=2034511 RepID=UPI000BFF009A|nr:hypothetical protein [Mycolicibacterium palauense]
MDTTHTRSAPTDAAVIPPEPPLPEPAGTIWVDFGDGGSARWAGLSTTTLDQVCAHLETVKKPDTLT